MSRGNGGCVERTVTPPAPTGAPDLTAQQRQSETEIETWPRRIMLASLCNVGPTHNRLCVARETRLIDEGRSFTLGSQDPGVRCINTFLR